jgi:hypothetical protein
VTDISSGRKKNPDEINILVDGEEIQRTMGTMSL